MSLSQRAVDGQSHGLQSGNPEVYIKEELNITFLIFLPFKCDFLYGFTKSNSFDI